VYVIHFPFQDRKRFRLPVLYFRRMQDISFFFNFNNAIP